MHVRLKALSLTALALVIMLSSVAAQAAAIGLPAAAEDGLEAKARAIINVAVKAEARVNVLIDMIEGNETIMKAIVNAGLNSSFNDMIALRDQGSDFLEKAKSSLEAGNYTKAIEEAIEAMRLLRDAYTGIHKILRQAGVTPLELGEAPELKAQGLLVAANRSLERIERIRSLPNASEVEGLLSQAENLLNNIGPLLEQGNVSAAAHNLAEANKLISEAFARLGRRAEEMIQKRAEKFVLDFGRIRNEFTRRIREEGLNETEILEGLGFGNLGQVVQNLTETVKGAGKKFRDVIKEIIEDLKGIGRILREVREIVPEKPSIRVKVGDILANASAAFNGKIVRVEGKYYGEKPPEDLLGPSGAPPKRNWWILADDTGWIYIVGEERVGIIRRLPILEGAEVTVIGRVVVEDDTLYIRATLMAPSEPIIVPVPPIGPTKPVTPSDGLRLSVKVERVGRDYSVKVTLENIGNETIVFPNSAYGIVIERKIAAAWVPIYTPIAAQVLTKLKPGENATVTILLERPLKPPSPGTYRAVATGWLEGSGLPVTASAEFTMP